MGSQWLQSAAAAAKAICQNAYAPYSKFRVGAAVVLPDGHVIAGCNVENASYGLSICAERSAVFRCIAEGHREMLAVVVYTPTTTPTAPCGACRQVIMEFAPNATIYSVCDSPQVLESVAEDLLPHSFGPHSIGKPAD